MQTRFSGPRKEDRGVVVAIYISIWRLSVKNQQGIRVLSIACPGDLSGSLEVQAELPVDYEALCSDAGRREQKIVDSPRRDQVRSHPGTINLALEIEDDLRH
ncbi:MAG TPA: hypothetical protein VGI45_12820 [Terracidiphilus sp.]